MTTVLQARAATLRAAIQAGDFVAGRAALDAYTAELQRFAESAARDRATLRRLENEWNHLVVWTRSMAATSREDARREWTQLRSADRLHLPCQQREPSIVDVRG